MKRKKKVTKSQWIEVIIIIGINLICMALAIATVK